MRCYVMLGQFAAVEKLPDLTDREAVEKRRAVFERCKSSESGLDRFEVWDRARVVMQEPPPTNRPTGANAQ
jgi:hypothetical protein